MSRRDVEAGAYGPLNGADDYEPPSLSTRSTNTSTIPNGPTRSIYALTRPEIASGLANRLVHSRAYVVLYLVMALASAATVLLSLTTKKGHCPPVMFYVLEVVVNLVMVLEVAVRVVAFGRRFWQSALNFFDVLVTIGCCVTLVVLAFARCGTGATGEEVLDTLLLVARNVLQFVRLAGVLRQSGHSMFSRPRPLDLSSAAAARRAGLDLDVDFADGYDVDDLNGGGSDADELGRPLVRPQDREPERPVPRPAARPMSDMPRAAQAAVNRDEEDMWAELG